MILNTATHSSNKPTIKPSILSSFSIEILVAIYEYETPQSLTLLVSGTGHSGLPSACPRPNQKNPNLHCHQVITHSHSHPTLQTNLPQKRFQRRTPHRLPHLLRQPGPPRRNPQRPPHPPLQKPHPNLRPRHHRIRKHRQHSRPPLRRRPERQTRIRPSSRPGREQLCC